MDMGCQITGPKVARMFRLFRLTLRMFRRRLKLRLLLCVLVGGR